MCRLSGRVWSTIQQKRQHERVSRLYRENGDLVQGKSHLGDDAILGSQRGRVTAQSRWQHGKLRNVVPALRGYRPPLPARSLELPMTRGRTGVSVESGLVGLYGLKLPARNSL
jgi:hypothetical protein